MPYRGPLLKDLRGAKKQQRISQLAASPATRKAIPDALLPLVYRKAREQAVYGKQPAAPGSPLTNADVARQANAATQLQYGAQDRLLQRQQAQGPDYYQAYLDELKKSQAGALAQGAQTGEAVQRLYSSGPQAPGSNQSVLGAAQAGTANLLGQVEANHQAALMNAVESGKLKFLAGLGLQRADLEQTKGAFNVEQRAKIKQQAGQDAATAALAGVKESQATTAAQTAKTNARTARINARANQTRADKAGAVSPVDKAKLDFFNKHGYWPPTGPPKSKKGKGGSGGTDSPVTGPGSLPRAEEAKRVSQVTRAAQYLHDVKIPDKDPKTGAVIYKKANNRGEVIAWLKSHGINPDLLGVANSLAANNLKGIGPKGVKHAHDAGLHVGGRWKTVKGS